MKIMAKERIVILGAAGKDFHVFNCVYRENPNVEIVAFTGTQIMGITGRTYPPVLSGKLYPEGIPILDEKDLPQIIKDKNIDTCVFAYSDVSHNEVMHLATLVNVNGADFKLLSMDKTMLVTHKPVISINAVRTGVGKSQTGRYITNILKDLGFKVAAIRHPMPYGDLSKQVSQRFATYKDLDLHECTIEEREEYEPYIDKGFIIFAGIDYQKILSMAEKEADVIVWDGGNNDTPFLKPNLHICLADPHRPGHEILYHPGETNFRAADTIVINKCDSAKKKDINSIIENAKRINPNAQIIKCNSPIIVENSSEIEGKRVLVIEDGPTITHGSLSTGAAMLAAKKFGAKEVVDPKPHVIGTIKAAFDKYKQLDLALPALGYSDQQLKELEQVINSVDCDLVLSGTPIDITRVIKVTKKIVRVRYELEEQEGTRLKDLVTKAVRK
jgi:predicted GTPase